MVVATLRVKDIWKKVAPAESKPTSATPDLEPTPNQETAVAQHARVTKEYRDDGERILPASR